MNFCLPKRTTKLWIIRVSVIAAILVFAFVYLSVSVSNYFFIGIITVFALYLFAILFYIPKLMKSFSLKISEKGITVKYGVFFFAEQIMPVTRFVFVQANTTPLSKLMKLKSVSFFAAKARVNMPELDEGDVQKITDFVKKAGKND